MNIKQNRLKASCYILMFLSLNMITTLVQGQSFGQDSYPAPSYPKMTPPTSVEDIMPYARAFAANENGFLGHGFGILNPGEKAIFVTSTIAEGSELYFEALMRAIRERGVEPILMHDYEIAGVTLEEARRLRDHINQSGGAIATFSVTDSQNGWAEGCSKFNLNDFLKDTRPDLYRLCNPPAASGDLPPDLKVISDKLATISYPNHTIANFINAYIDEHPDVKGVFWGRGGPIWEAFHPHKERWLGLLRFDNMWTAMSPRSDFPADVWLMSEEMTMEPIAATDKVTITDPEGTDVWWDVSEEQAQRWKDGVYLRGHMFMFPQEAFGSYGLNALNYPATVPEYIPASPIAKLNGKIVSHVSHVGFYPQMQEIWEDGYLKEVKGGGYYGELIRTMMKMPGIHEKTWPNYDEPGYFHHFESALGTNPKGLRPDITAGPIAAERERDGIIHWAMGSIVWHDPGVLAVPPPSGVKFEEENKLPASHGFHQHTYFNTINMRIRGTDKWVTVVDKGRSTSLDHPETRALASRYGDPDRVLATEWVPEIPGINAPGNYETYVQDPWPYNRDVMEQVKAGAYNKYNPDVRPPRN